MMILNILMILLGLSMLIYSFFEIRIYGSLFFDRDIYCIEKFRKTTKATDLVSGMHHLAKCTFGFSLIVIGLKRWMPESGYAAAGTSLLISFAALVLDVLILETVTRTRGLKGIRTAIENQWRKQKHFTPEHDHEVNLYRGTVRVTQQYPRHIVAMAAAMLVLSVFL